MEKVYTKDDIDIEIIEDDPLQGLIDNYNLNRQREIDKNALNSLFHLALFVLVVFGTVIFAPIIFSLMFPIILVYGFNKIMDSITGDDSAGRLLEILRFWNWGIWKIFRKI